MPAAAVIPALLVYIKVVAVKKLVVECRLALALLPLAAGYELAFCRYGCAFTRAAVLSDSLH